MTDDHSVPGVVRVCGARWFVPWDEASAFVCDAEDGHDGPHACTLEAEGQSEAVVTWEA